MLRLGPNPQQDSPPLMIVEDIAARLKINSNSVGRCIRKFYLDKGWDLNNKEAWQGRETGFV